MRAVGVPDKVLGVSYVLFSEAITSRRGEVDQESDGLPGQRH